MARILLVEDNEMNRDLLVRRLKRRGFDVETAENGQWAISTARVARPDLILMDMNMPEIDGWEATRQLKADPTTAGIPVVALTAHAMPEDRERALAAGCDDYHAKPVRFDELLETIHRFVGATD